ncbi:class I SAM-dependent methyltransferase [Echinicola vietnamensis]|uniref:Methyltransferase family protein n=1 Tax=Echinicola vietnamensis (strain DSM 17526 / LMG 23754 / KMM 6221) TaxID=926556 RepID=L0G1I6_ECHVK|nr:class I SAM-dependent methyltransferase [Echinicola vietnamensis]AGA78871.1 methyltransferase family protein [Echinicola vietnamensis DSM 17526]
MEDKWLEKWNERYSDPAFAYGEEPNEYLKEQLEKLDPGKILFPAEGEGRNAIFAAQSGWEVSAFDISKVGREKAKQWATRQGVVLDYQVGELPRLDYHEGQFDAIALIYAHFPATIKSTYHKILVDYLRPGGHVIFEAFGKNHLALRNQNPKVGGPKDVDTLFSVAELKADFKNVEMLNLEEKVISLREGLYHNGEGSVIRFVGKKK